MINIVKYWKPKRICLKKTLGWKILEGTEYKINIQFSIITQNATKMEKEIVFYLINQL